MLCSMQDLSSLTGKVEAQSHSSAVEAQSLKHSAAQEGSMVASKIIFKRSSLLIPAPQKGNPA